MRECTKCGKSFPADAVTYCNTCDVHYCFDCGLEVEFDQNVCRDHLSRYIDTLKIRAKKARLLTLEARDKCSDAAGELIP